MWQLLAPFRERTEGRRNPGRYTRRYRLQCQPLEDRCLLSVSLTDSGPLVPLVGSPVVWTAAASGHGESPVYQFSVGPIGGVFHVVRDFDASDSFTWNPMQEGRYDIRVTVKDGFDSSTGESATATYTATSRVTGSSAVISPMSNPLVALYSAPPSPGTSMYVQFARMGSSLSWQSTATQPIVPGESTNFIVAGMLPNTTYLMRHVLDDGTISAPLTFTTGSLPTNLSFPTFTIKQAPAPGTDPTQDMILHMNLADTAGTINTLATDLDGDITWYYDSVANGPVGYATTLEPGGTVFLMGPQVVGTTLKEIDLAGDTLLETNSDALSAQLVALGQHPISDLDHDAQILPNGDIAVLAKTSRTIDVNGTPTNYNGDMVLVLDQDLRVTWVWDAFDWLDTNRLGTDGETSSDWLHANAIAWSPEDGDLLVSLRAQDWVIKIDYADGTGDGHVVWRLGQGGDFTVVAPPGTQYPWFSHQHDARYINDSTIVVFDDGNTRHDTTSSKDSRGQEWVLDEKTMTATLVVNADLGNYSVALGSAQILPNGNLAFTSDAQSIEVLPDGTRTYVQQLSGLPEYRSYFESSLYVPPANPTTASVTDATATVGASATTAVFTVALASATGLPVWVHYATSDGTARAGLDYAATGGTLYIAPGETNATISVPVAADTEPGPDRTFSLALSQPTNVTLGTGAGTAKIVNNNRAGSLSLDMTSYSVDADAGTATVTVSRSDGSAGTVTVQYAISDGTARAGLDYAATGGTLIFGPGVMSQTFTVSILNNILAPGSADATLTLSNPTGLATLGTISAATLVINPAALRLDSIRVQNGLASRSFIRYIDLEFNQRAGLQDIVDSLSTAAPRLTVTFHGLHGTLNVPVPLLASQIKVVGTTLSLDFGAGGITGRPRSRLGDGYYQISVDLNGDGNFTTETFDRLLGDVNGDGRVNMADLRVVRRAFQTSGTDPGGDVDGRGAVRRIDRWLIVRSFGREISATRPGRRGFGTRRFHYHGR